MTTDSSYVELQQQDNENPPIVARVDIPPERQRRIPTRMIWFCAGLIMLTISVIIYSILTPYAASIACPDCNVYCDRCNCNAINGTQAQLDLCERCAWCVADDCSNFRHDVSSRFAEIFWYVGMISWFIVFTHCGSDREERRR